MAILNIKKYPDPILREKCKEVKEITPEIKELALNMAETTIQGRGIGMAASQVGVLKRIIVVQIGETPKVFINPRIVKKSWQKGVMEEGCLSFPNLFLEIKRSKEAEVEVLKLNGEKIKIKTKGLVARVFQHEIDHLDGILFFDRIGFWQRFKLRKTLKQHGID